MAEGLSQAGYHVYGASNGTDGLALFQKYLPYCVITDLVMDGIEGIESIQKIRQLAPETHIIAISGNPDYLRSSGKLGADKLLLKPFRIPQLIEAIESALHDQPDT